MKNNFFLITAFFLMLSIAGIAQGKHEMAVANAVEQLRQAMVNGDKAALESIVAENLSYGHSGGHIDNKKEFVEKLTNGTSDFVTMDLTDQVITMSGKTAIVRHILKAKTNDGGKAGEVHLRILLVWQKMGVKWKLLARQAVKVV
ncbi:MAG: nuclear transport factor 2 family protein [Chitinophagaceae bacterium]|nr:nuclear transport factor 2 family protein [Chitinophagaceae bacterium]